MQERLTAEGAHNLGLDVGIVGALVDDVRRRVEALQKVDARADGRDDWALPLRLMTWGAKAPL